MGCLFGVVLFPAVVFLEAVSLLGLSFLNTL
jgi:hypothetical protein